MEEIRQYSKDQQLKQVDDAIAALHEYRKLVEEVSLNDVKNKDFFGFNLTVSADYNEGNIAALRCIGSGIGLYKYFVAHSILEGKDEPMLIQLACDVIRAHIGEELSSGITPDMSINPDDTIK